jgi:hypothetical protein
MNYSVRGISLAVVISILGSLPAYASNPEFNLVQGLFAASGDDLGSTQGRDLYQKQVSGLIQTYSTHHTADPEQAMNNVTGAFQTLGIPDQEVAQVQNVTSRYAKSLSTAGTMSTAETQAFWQQYGKDLSSALQSIPYPQGAEFSSCQWSVTVAAVGLAIGVPELMYTIGEGMGDRNVSSWISNSGSILFLVGLSGAIAIFPTCL